jgi:cytochrome c peroxidase
MKSIHSMWLFGALIIAVAACSQGGAEGVARQENALTGQDLLGVSDPGGDFVNPAGLHRSISLLGTIDKTNPFFQAVEPPLGNGRACVTCHAPIDGFGLSAASARARFFATCSSGQSEQGEPTCGTDPLFKFDGLNTPFEDVSTDAAREKASSLLINKGLIRIELPVPTSRDYDILSVNDPYDYAEKALEEGRLVFYRRPLPATNLKFFDAFGEEHTNAAAIMWDGRESYTTCVSTVTPVWGAACDDVTPCADGLTCQLGFCRVTPQCSNPPDKLRVFDLLKDQASNATLRHAQAVAPLTVDQQNAIVKIVEFERNLFTAQVSGKGTGDLTDGANGGPDYLSTVFFINGINRRPPIGTDPTAPHPPFTVFLKWAGVADPHRAAVARGQDLFNNRAIVNPRLGSSSVNGLSFTCAFCHTAPEAGTDSAGTWGNAVTDTIGAFTAGVGKPSLRRNTDLPRYRVRSRVTGQMVTTTDLGRAAITGWFTDLNKFKTPSLRGLAARAPYFHNGSAATLLDVIDAYEDAGFFPPGFELKPEEKADLVAFLESL